MGTAAVVLLATSSASSRTVLAEYSVPGAVQYNDNGGFPLPQDPDPAASLVPLAYGTNGQFPEPIINPADGLVPVSYRDNGLVVVQHSMPCLVRVVVPAPMSALAHHQPK